MSQTIVTFSDLINVQRLGSNLALNDAIDNGTGFNFDISGVIVPNPYTLAGDKIVGVISNGASTYRLNADIDWASLIVPISVNARISKIRIVCNGNWSMSASAAVTEVAPGNTWIGDALAGGDVQVMAPNASGVYTPSAYQDLTDISFQQQATPVNAFSLSASVFNAGQFVEKTWDFTITLPGGLAYIPYADLVTYFTNTQIQCRPTSLIGGGAQSSFNVTAVAVLGTSTLSSSAQMLIQTSLWEVIIDWESAVVSSILPNPATTGDTVSIVGTGLTGVDTIRYTDADGVVHNIAITPVINTATLVTFIMPALGTYFMGTVTLFSGAVSLGTLTVYVATGSGIYQIVLNKRNDTLYNRATGLTTDTAIPEPFGETGLIGG